MGRAMGPRRVHDAKVPAYMQACRGIKHVCIENQRILEMRFSFPTNTCLRLSLVVSACLLPVFRTRHSCGDQASFFFFFSLFSSCYRVSRRFTAHPGLIYTSIHDRKQTCNPLVAPSPHTHQHHLRCAWSYNFKIYTPEVSSASLPRRDEFEEWIAVYKKKRKEINPKNANKLIK